MLPAVYGGSKPEMKPVFNPNGYPEVIDSGLNDAMIREWIAEFEPALDREIRKGRA